MDDRWDRLFADLEALATPALDEDEIPDMVEAERVAVALADRLAGAVGRHADLLTRAGRRLGGTVREAGPDWVALAAASSLHVVPLVAVRWVAALDGPSRPSHGAVRASLAAVVRRLARTGLPVVADVDGAVLRGAIVAVGADHCDLATETAVLTVPLAVLDGLRVDALSAGWDE